MPLPTDQEIEGLSDETLYFAVAYCVGECTPDAGDTWYSWFERSWWRKHAWWLIDGETNPSNPYRRCGTASVAAWKTAVAERGASLASLTRQSGETDRQLAIRVVKWRRDLDAAA